MDHRSLSQRTPHKSAYGLTPDVAHITEFGLWETILIFDDKTQFPDSWEIFGYCTGPAPNKGNIGCSWVWTEEHGLLARYFLCHANSPTDPNRQMVPVSE